jgi:hypothetical protein
MIIDNLKDINCVADLFRYIANIEEENEKLHKQVDSLLIDHDRLVNANLRLKELLERTEHTLEFYESKVVPKEKEND